MRRILPVLAFALATASPLALLSQDYTGPITVTDTTTDTVLGYISGAQNGFGEYTVVPTTSGALNVTFNESSASPFDIAINNPFDSNYSDLGGITGFSNSSPDLGSGSFNYSYLGESAATAPGATPANVGNSFTDATGIPEDSESALWSVDAATGILSAQWINTDGSSPATFAAFTQDALVLTGDLGAFEGAFGGDTVEFSIPASAPATPEPSSFLLLGTGIVSLVGLARRRLKA
jgi:hypothetical protein